MSISSSESKAIGLLRFSLIILIVFGHMRPNTVSIQAADFSLLSGHGISNVIAIVLSYLRITNQAYFLISGYLFWQGMEGWDWNVFTRKIKTRSKTLLLPYVLWIVFSIGTFVALMLYQDIKAGASFSNILEYLHGIGIKGFWNYHVWGLDKVDWLGNPTPNTAPFVLTLWFVRDLMVVTLFAPLLYWLFKKTKVWGILLLMFCYVSKIWPQIDGFTIEAFSFFGLGLYISMNGKTLVGVADQLKIPAIIVSFFSFFACLYFGGNVTPIGRFIFPVFVISCIWIYIKFAEYITKQKGFELAPFLAKSTFFIYLLHACPIAGIRSIISKTNTIIYSAVHHFSAPWLLYYLISPFIIVAICLLIYYIMQRWTPKLCSLLTGSRMPKAEQSTTK